MCGLVSVISKQKNGLYHIDTKIFTEMLFADQLRGSDGTGIFYNSKEKVKVMKDAVASSDFVNTKEYDKAMSDCVMSGNFIVGHNRSATKGNLSVANTHPFQEKHITLVHNGTIHGHEKLANTEVDSHAICHSIANIGIKETATKISGAYALIWYDSNQKTLNLIHNTLRPLYVVNTNFFYCFVSEPGLAKWICERNKQNIIDVKEVPVNTQIIFSSSNWDTYTEKTVLQYAPTPWVPPVYKQPAKSFSKPISNFPKIGEAIKFVPLEIENANETKIIGEWEDTRTGELVEVRFWAANKDHAKDLLKATVLQGTITHIAYNKVEKTQFFILKDAYNCNQEKKVDKEDTKIVATTFNKRKLTKGDIKNKLNKVCTMCGGSLGNLYHACNIIEGTGTSLNGTCPDCTEFIYHESNNHPGKGMSYYD